MIEKSKYNEFINEVFDLIQLARENAFRSLTQHQTVLYFELGKLIVRNQEIHSWGKSIVENLSKDLAKRTGGAKGYSPQNLWFMRQFYLEYKDTPDLLTLAEKVPWGHNLLIIRKTSTGEEREYYLRSTIEYAWTRSVLLNQIKGDAYNAYQINPKQNNFQSALPAYISEQMDEALKSEYNLDFLGLNGPVHERELESRLIEKIRDFVMELGYGFCFIGSQYRLRLSEKEYFVDLMFYHRILKCIVAIELKTVEFEPEFAGKMNFYLELIDEQMKQEDDNPSIGIILCPEKDDIEVEYALRIVNKPIGVAEYRLTNQLPKRLRGKLPSPSEIKSRLKGEGL